MWQGRQQERQRQQVECQTEVAHKQNTMEASGVRGSWGSVSVDQQEQVIACRGWMGVRQK